LTIMRLWHGKVDIEKADEYEKFMIKRAVPDYSSVDGFSSYNHLGFVRVS